MPLYEDKIVCPLAVRFTQEHVRPVFQNGLDLESTISQIKTKPGSGDYDVILDTPFDAIEIIRWRKRDLSGEEPAATHWLTFDNRRLYCLQRAAVALWPQRVGVVVQALYAATNGYDRKDNSMTAGRKVGIGHSPKLLTGRWHWRSAVAETQGESAYGLVARDEALEDVEELLDAPAPPSMLDLFFREGGAAFEAKAALEERSTVDASSPRSITGVSEASDGLAATLAEGLCGRWRGPRGEAHEVWRTPQGFVCSSAQGSGAPRRADVWHDAQADLVWWGGFYAEAAEIRRQGGSVRWYGSDGSWTPRTTWRWNGAAGHDLHPASASGVARQRRRSCETRSA
mmetsp:Transcript_126124/g.353149  ORF Transcript_126124/g.353149 Transcript_126124/m.353149 type:complete len:342 (+) Transcript_126124:144-1169(+)